MAHAFQNTFSLVMVVCCLFTTKSDAQELIAKTDPLTAAEQQKKFHLPPGFEIQLVAAEPNIRKPINLNFDARGSLYATQSVEYPFGAKAGAVPRDVVKVFDEIGADGRPKHVRTLIDKLDIPIGVLPYGDSTIVYSIPKLYKMTDTNGDGKSDKRSVLYGTFGTRDRHGMCSSLTAWVDGWIYGCHGFSNTSQLVGTDGNKVTMNSGNTYRFRPDGRRIEQRTWGQVNPFGLCFDPLGNIFTSDCHSMPVYNLLRGAYYPSFGKPHDGLGFGPKMLNHNHGSTGIAGVVYYAATHFPPAYRDTIFIGNPVTGRVNHDRLEVRGSSFWCLEQPDFIRCDDPWFRPVDVQLGPDGALYIADFYNRIIGHYEVPLNHPGRDRQRGRIWRVVYTGKGVDGKSFSPANIPNLANATMNQLFDYLESKNITARVRATNQIVHRFGSQATQAATESLASGSATRVAHSMWILERSTTLSAAQIKTLAAHKSRLVRVHVIKLLGERKKWGEPIAELVRAAINDKDAFVRRAAADALGLHPNPKNIGPLLHRWTCCDAKDTHLIHTTRMALRDQLRVAGAYKLLSAKVIEDAGASAKIAEVSLGVRDAPSARFVLKHVAKSSGQSSFLETELHYAARYIDQNLLPQVYQTAEKIAGSDIHRQFITLRSLQRAMAERQMSLPDAQRKWALRVTRKLLGSQGESPQRDGIELAQSLRFGEEFEVLSQIAIKSKHADLRTRAIQACAAIDGARSVKTFGALIAKGEESIALRQQAAAALASINSNASRAALVEKLVSAPQQVCVTIATGLARQPAGAKSLLAAIATGKASATLLRERGVLDGLKQSKIKNLEQQIAKLTRNIPKLNQRIAGLIRTRAIGFTAAKPDIQRGKALFTKQCAICHSVGGEGAKIGPDLDGIGLRGVHRLLEDVLDPSRNVDQNFRATNILMSDGAIVSGMVLRKTGNVLILADAQGKEVTLDENDIEQQTTTTLSPMPANVAELVAERDFYDLMAFLLAQRKLAPKPNDKDNH